MKRNIILVCILVFMVFVFSCKNNDISNVNNAELNDTTASQDNVQLKDDTNQVYDLEEGMTMPDVKVETNKGTTFDLNTNEKPVLINFWATWCPPCRMEMPGLQSLYEEYRDKIDFVMINLGETKETIQDFLVENEVYTFPIGYDMEGIYGLKFNIAAIPTTIIVGEDKVIKNYIVGARDESQFKEYLEAVIKK